MMGPGYHYEDGHHANGTFDGHMGLGYHYEGGHMGPGYHHGGDHHFNNPSGMRGSHMWGPGVGGWMFL